MSEAHTGSGRHGSNISLLSPTPSSPTSPTPPTSWSSLSEFEQRLYIAIASTTVSVLHDAFGWWAVPASPPSSSPSSSSIPISPIKTSGDWVPKRSTPSMAKAGRGRGSGVKAREGGGERVNEEEEEEDEEAAHLDPESLNASLVPCIAHAWILLVVSDSVLLLSTTRTFGSAWCCMG